MTDVFPDLIWLVLRWLAGGVLVVSGFLKWRRDEKLAASLVPLGIPQRLAESPFITKFAVPMFPYAEVVMGLAVILGQGWLRTLALIGATTMYAGFLFLTARVTLRKEVAECECFGGLTDGAVNGKTVLRNTLFFVAAIGGWFDRSNVLTASIIVAFLALTLAFVLMGVRSRREQEARDTALQGLSLTRLTGEEVALSEFTREPQTLVFLSASCSNCQTLAKQLGEGNKSSASYANLNVVLMGKREEFDYFQAFYPLLTTDWGGTSWFDGDKSVATAMGRLGTPGLVRTTPQQPLGSGWVRGLDQITNLIESQ